MPWEGPSQLQVSILNPSFDRIWDASWSVETANASGGVFESCIVDAPRSLLPADATLKAYLGRLGSDLGTLPSRRAIASFSVEELCMCLCYIAPAAEEARD